MPWRNTLHITTAEVSRRNVWMLAQSLAACHGATWCSDLWMLPAHVLYHLYHLFNLVLGTGSCVRCCTVHDATLRIEVPASLVCSTQIGGPAAAVVRLHGYSGLLCAT
eukprot:1159551-Pelagomonas_calceolata.AAC.9